MALSMLLGSTMSCYCYTEAKRGLPESSRPCAGVLGFQTSEWLVVFTVAFLRSWNFTNNPPFFTFRASQCFVLLSSIRIRCYEEIKIEAPLFVLGPNFTTLLGMFDQVNK